MHVGGLDRTPGAAPRAAHATAAERLFTLIHNAGELPAAISSQFTGNQALQVLLR